MSSDLKELKGLICRKRISKIKKKYESAEKRVYRKLLDCNKNKNEEYLTKCVFIEFKKRYFSDFCKRVDDLVTSYTVGI